VLFPDGQIVEQTVSARNHPLPIAASPRKLK
jgi:hypothetical protein